MKKFISTYYPGLIILVIAIIAGIFTYQDYGISWDEPAQRLIGTINYNYACGKDATLLSFADKEYGAGFELPLIMLEKCLRLTDSRDIYLMRHLATHTFFLLSMFAGYILICRLFKKQSLACLGFVMLVAAPRIYAHSFYNTKDIPFLSMVLVSLAVSHLAFEQKKPGLFLLMGICLGYTTGIRIMGILPVSVIIFFLCADMVTSLYDKEEKITKPVIRAVLFKIGFLFSSHGLIS